jgi:hypothetical protein
MSFEKDFPVEEKKIGKKVAVILSEDIDHELSLELLSGIYEDLDLEPISFERAPLCQNPFIGDSDNLAPLVVDARSEIVSPSMRMFDSEILIFNYRKFYKT